MTGSPVFRTFLAALCLAGLSLTLLRLTASAPAVIAGPARNSAAHPPVPMRVRIRCSETPTSLSIASGTQPLTALDASATFPWEGTASVPIPPEGLELTLTSVWPQTATGSHAITVELEPDERDARSQTAWTDPADPSQLTAFLSYRWK